MLRNLDVTKFKAVYPKTATENITLGMWAKYAIAWNNIRFAINEPPKI